MNKVKQISIKQKRQQAVRKRLHGTAARPRLSVYRSNRFIYVQLIDDDAGKSLMGETDAAKDSKIKGTKTEKASLVAKEIAKRMKTKKIQEIVFDRGPYRYHGRVKTVADSLREEGIKF
jgi:large subunit ribosomal protein L18